MPVKIKILISILIMVVYVMIGLHDYSISLKIPGLIAFLLSGFMVISIWIFPDVSRDDPADKSG